MTKYRRRNQPTVTQWNKPGDHNAVVSVPAGAASNSFRPGADITTCGWIFDDARNNGGIGVHAGDWIIDHPHEDGLEVISDEQFKREYEEVKDKEEEDDKPSPKKSSFGSPSNRTNNLKK